jgi:hypothetical protein
LIPLKFILLYCPTSLVTKLIELLNNKEELASGFQSFSARAEDLIQILLRVVSGLLTSLHRHVSEPRILGS